MVITAAPTAPTVPAPTAPDPRRISEADPDFTRLRAYWLRRLMASVGALVSDIRRGGPHAVGPAQSAFIHRHTLLLQQAYVAAHREGQRDYWQAVSNTPSKWLKTRPVAPSVAQIQRRLLFYAAASVTKLARAAEVTYNQSRVTKSSSSPNAASASSVSSSSHLLADPPADLAFDQYAAWASPRVGLQVDITWSGFQDGYLDAASADLAGLRLQLWWDLEPAAQHCDDCPAVAAGSPYDAPGSGGNELDQTPGDGQTACGAACKCSLRYGYSDMTYAGLPGLPGDNEVLGPANETPAMTTGRAPAPPTGPIPADWQQQHIADLYRGAGVEAPPTQVTPPAPTADDWDARRDAAIAAGQGANAPAGSEVSAVGEYDVRRAEAIVAAGYGTAALPQQLTAIEDLTTGQKAALDKVRAVALLWDEWRGDLPLFQAYFDPDSARNVWADSAENRWNATQRGLIERFFAALGDWADATPIDEQ